MSTKPSWPKWNASTPFIPTFPQTPSLYAPVKAFGDGLHLPTPLVPTLSFPASRALVPSIQCPSWPWGSGLTDADVAPEIDLDELTRIVRSWFDVLLDFCDWVCSLVEKLILLQERISLALLQAASPLMWRG